LKANKLNFTSILNSLTNKQNKFVLINKLLMLKAFLLVLLKMENTLKTDILLIKLKFMKEILIKVLKMVMENLQMLFISILVIFNKIFILVKVNLLHKNRFMLDNLNKD
jgi:hypothetical protein